MEEDSILSLIHEELKRQIGTALDPAWKAAVLALAEDEDREYLVITAFSNELRAAMARVREFPRNYPRIRGKLPEPAAAGYPEMAECPVCHALNRKGQTPCPWCAEHPAGLTATVLPWQREAARGAA